MSPKGTLDRLLEVLADERAALRAMDGPRVDLAANEKERLFAELVAGDAFRRPELREQLAQLVAELRRNTILLAQARDCTKDAVAAMGVVLAAPHSTALATTLRPARLSTHG
jgi:hypothetical protein